jgi:hypothetical protein
MHTVHLWMENLKRTDHLEDLGVEGNNESYIIKMRRCGLYISDSGKGPAGGSCEHGDEPSGGTFFTE